MPVTDLAEITTQPRETVEVWTVGVSDWVAVPDLHCIDLQRSVLPNRGISRATLVWRYGQISTDRDESTTTATGEAVFATLTPLSLNRSIVRITITPDNGVGSFQWVGLVVATENKRESDSTNGPTFGDQVFEVVGPEWFLSRIQIVEADIATGDNAADVKRIGHAIPFNMREEHRRNDSPAAYPNRDDTHPNAFVRDGGTAGVWNGQQIAEYLQRFLPAGFPDDPSPSVSPWVMSGEDNLEWMTPQLAPHGKTLSALFDELANPKRAMHWRIRYDSAANVPFGQFIIEFGTSTQYPIILPGGVNIAGNSNLQILSPRSRSDADQVVITDTQQQYEQVICLGARISVGGTFSIDDESLTEGWSSSDEDAYKEGASNEGDYPTDLSERYARNATLRSDRYPHVFTRFLVRTDGTFDLESADFFNEPTYLQMLRFERETPMFENWDYSVDPPVPRANALPVPDTRNMFAIYELPDGAFVYADKQKRPNELQELSIAATLIPMENALGFTLTPGKQPHEQALGISSLIDADEDTQPEVDYKKMLVTAFIESTSHVQGFFPATIQPAKNFMQTELIIQLGDAARLDVIKPNTVVDVFDGELIRSPAGSDLIIRDDRDYLTSIATMAWQWYGKERHAANIVYKQITTEVPLGSIVSSLDGVVTDSLVTEIRYNFQQGVTVVSIAYARPEFQAIVASGGAQSVKIRAVRTEQQLRKLQQRLDRLTAADGNVNEPRTVRRAVTRAETGPPAVPYPSVGPFWPIRFKNSGGTDRQADAKTQAENIRGNVFVPEGTPLVVFRIGQSWFFEWSSAMGGSTECLNSSSGSLQDPVTVQIQGITAGTSSAAEAAVLNQTHTLTSENAANGCSRQLVLDQAAGGGNEYTISIELSDDGSGNRQWILAIQSTQGGDKSWGSTAVAGTIDPTQQAVFSTVINNLGDIPATGNALDFSGITITVNP
jgi:hypothetical protein